MIRVPIASSSCETLRDEYWFHVASQEEMPLAGNARPPLALSKLDKIYPAGSDYERGSLAVSDITYWIVERPEIALELRFVLSVADKRFYLDLSYIFSREPVSPGSERTICGCLPNAMKKHSTSAILGFVARGPEDRRHRAAESIAEYLVAKGLLIVLDLYFSLDRNQRVAINDLWLSPKDIQQNETKRRRHGAEGEVAQAFVDAGLAVFPPDKATDPMGSHDPNVSRTLFEITPRIAGETTSVDVCVLDATGKLAIMLVGLVQSSDPGQFGVDKAATNREIRKDLDIFRDTTGSTLEFWGIVDGIGYAENPNGTIYRMLEYFDHFVQHNSTYKAILGAGRLGLANPVAIMYDMDFYTPLARDQMHARYGGSVNRIDDTASAPAGAKAIKAGRATVWIA